jgi:SAM-dependent methyltransferase
MAEPQRQACPVCGSQSSRSLPSDAIHCCGECSHWFSTFEPRINELGRGSMGIDIELKNALRGARATTDAEALDLVAKKRRLPGLRHLDVGCSTGQFLQASEQRGSIADGIEPERAFVEIAQRAGHRVTAGYFPQSVGSTGPFDLISFMDVLGHIPELRETGEAARRLLTEDGYLLIKTPTADGALFRLGHWSRRLGVQSLWQRLWQLSFASPQIHYFTSASMHRFASEIGGTVVASRRFPALERSGLWGRLLPGRAMPYWKALPVYLVLCILLPLINALPQDSLLVLIQASGSPRNTET